MKILVIGSGGREHALAWKLAKEGCEVLGMPGNPGIAEVGSIVPGTDYLAAARSLSPDLTVVGPELPLVSGIVDAFRAEGFPIIGPAKQQAQLEGSKIYAKQFMEAAGIPTARSVRADTREEALRAIRQFEFPVVIKADGLAAGKGVVIAEDAAAAQSAIASLGERFVIEERLVGEEVSFIALSDGRTAVPLAATQDHKNIFDNDCGPNTGGMGAYCDGRIVDAATSDMLLDRVISPVVARTEFTGFLYAGVMMTAEGPKVLEFNVRLGDPETQPLMHRMSSHLSEILLAAAHGRLDAAKFEWRSAPSVCVVLAAQGYPGQVRTGDPITGILECGAEVFQAGTRAGANGLETSGGRVLGVTARGDDLAQAIDNTYAAVSRIHFDGMQYRTDIGRKGLKRW